MRHTLSIAFFLNLAALVAYPQVPRKVIVEHFTNTRCSICASRNPGFYDNLDDHPGVIHLAVHPSSPYSNCMFNQHNVAENDARTHFYGVYGGTPRLVVQGAVVPAAADYTDGALFTDHSGEQSAFTLSIAQEYTAGFDSIRVTVTVEKVSAWPGDSAWLYAVLAESEIAYNAPNGETTHYDVFRKSLFGTAGTKVEVPAAVSSDLSYEATVPIDSEWSLDGLYALALLQDASGKEVIQAASAEGSPILGRNDNEPTTAKPRIFPNPFSGVVHLGAEIPPDRIEVFDLLGHRVYTERPVSSSIDLSFLPAGAYVMVTTTNGHAHPYRLVKQ